MGTGCGGGRQERMGLQGTPGRVWGSGDPGKGLGIRSVTWLGAFLVQFLTARCSSLAARDVLEQTGLVK